MVKSLVRFGYADRFLSINGKRAIQVFVMDIFQKELGLPCRLQYVFCSDEYLHKINLEYLQHDDYTDIITFDLSEDKVVRVDGEIYISVDRVKSNASSLGVVFFDEVLRVIFHGALHLCGYGDKTPKEQNEMRRMEDKYLGLYMQ